MTNRSEIYWESQRNGLCRLHAINAFFGYHKITEPQFLKYIKEYDLYLSSRFNIETSSAEFDLINSDQTNLVSWILKKYKFHFRYYPLNCQSHIKCRMQNTELKELITSSDFIFVYNFSHIWCIKRVKNKYYRIDSIGGVSPINVSNLYMQPNIGFMIQVSLKDEYEFQRNKIKCILSNNNITTQKELIQYLTLLRKKNEILGDLELPIGVAISTLETNLYKDGEYRKPPATFDEIINIINKYNEFISQFTAGNYSDLNLILKYIPDIIIGLIK